MNRGWRFCRPLPYRLATAPRKRQMAGLATRPAEPGEKKMLERETGFEPATSTLARSHSTTELFPLAEPQSYHSRRTPDNRPAASGTRSSGAALWFLACPLSVWYDAGFARSSGARSRAPRSQSAPSPSGKAEVCKTSIPGSNPGGASNLFRFIPATNLKDSSARAEKIGGSGRGNASPPCGDPIASCQLE